jgi:hypothetical protein
VTLVISSYSALSLSLSLSLSSYLVSIVLFNTTYLLYPLFLAPLFYSILSPSFLFSFFSTTSFFIDNYVYILRMDPIHFFSLSLSSIPLISPSLPSLLSPSLHSSLPPFLPSFFLPSLPPSSFFYQRKLMRPLLAPP